MDEQNIINQQQSQALPTQPMTNSLPPQFQKNQQKKFALPVLLIGVGIIIGAIAFFVFQQITKKPEKPTITTVVVTPTPTPTPFRYPTNVSTTSAFLELEQTIASFSNRLDEFSKHDPSLSPPNLILPLGL
ncbi:MAG: hypothetical protein N3A54_02960 [Patescibacteria group bacterium]|nr:hypothetical protein [Patescibacteria group bacterium]